MSGPIERPAAEVDITTDLVRSLLEDQHPDLADRPITELESGWDNVIFRLGDDLIVRLPRRRLSAELIEHEQRWLPGLARRLPLPVSAPVRTGRPAAGYPWAWSVGPWYEGRPALTAPLADPIDAAGTLGAFLRALHQPAPDDAPRNPYRGIPLADRDARTQEAIEQLAGHIDADRVRACWAAHLEVPAWNGPPLWLHGDLHPNNLIVRDGRLAAVIDFGDLTAGDPATDLAAAWMLLPSSARPALRAACSIDAATWTRGRAWALALGLAYLLTSASSPDYERIGRATIAAVLDEAAADGTI